MSEATDNSESARNVLIAVDGSEHSERAFNLLEVRYRTEYFLKKFYSIKILQCTVSINDPFCNEPCLSCVYLSDIRKSGDHVIIFHAQEMPTLPAAPYPYGFSYYEEWQDVMKKSDEEAKALLRHFGDILKQKEDIKFKLVKEGGRPGELICKNSEEESASIIVLGSRGQSAVRRTFLGSVSDYVVHHSHCPVSVVPPPHRHKH